VGVHRSASLDMSAEGRHSIRSTLDLWTRFGDVRYRWDMCPRSLNLLRRAVHQDINADMSDVNVEEFAGAVLKVIDALLRIGNLPA
jgi:hypothetical protein